MATTLGKRQARAWDSPSFTSRKRRTPVNDENVDPQYAQHTRENSENQRDLSLEDEAHSCKGLLPTARSRAKFTSQSGEISLSPTKINGLFKNTKSISRQHQGKICAPLTPQTPRHRDALSKQVPITPRHRVSLTRKLFSPRTPKTPSTPSNAPTIYNLARQLFVRSTAPDRLIGRDEERSKLNAFIQAGIESHRGRCMYVSGPPGTGKSALVSEVCRDLPKSERLRTTYINCMSIKDSKNIYSKLLEGLHDVELDLVDDNKDEVDFLRTMFVPTKKYTSTVYVVTLDEIDHLITLDLEILYTMFEWSLAQRSRLVLIGIANALDLTDRFLPRLKARNLKPQLLPFLPYTATQISSVITSKVRSLLPEDTAVPEYVPFIHPMAIQFCAKKVAAQTGDLRKAFDIIRRTIDVVEMETKQKHQSELDARLERSPCKMPLVDNTNLSSPCSPPRSAEQIQFSLTESLSRLTPKTAPRATIAHVSRITASVFNNGTAERLKALNLQQKAALCALVLLEKKNLKLDIFATPSKATNTAPTIRKVYEMYCGLCRRENALHPLTATEFTDVIGSLEMSSLVQRVEAKGMTRLGLTRLTPSKKPVWAEDRRIGSCVSEKEIVGCLEGLGGGILKALLRGDDD